MKRLYTNKMSDSTHTDELEPVDVKALMAEYAEMSFADLIMEVKDLKDALEREKTAHSYDERLLRKADEELNTLRGRIQAASVIMNGDADVCIDCAAVKDKDETEKDE
jgi:hypothetical protein